MVALEKFGAISVAIGLLVCGLGIPTDARAATVSWVFSSDARAVGLNSSGAPFDYQIVGSFNYDATLNQLSSVAVSMQGTGVVAGANFNAPGPLFAFNPDATLSFLSAAGTQLVLLSLSAFMSDLGGTINLANGSAGSCFAGNCNNGFTVPFEQFGASSSPRSLFGSITGTSPNAVPIPAALPLFATGLGALGLLGWRRKRKKSATAAAA